VHDRTKLCLFSQKHQLTTGLQKRLSVALMRFNMRLPTVGGAPIIESICKEASAALC